MILFPKQGNQPHFTHYKANTVTGYLPMKNIEESLPVIFM